MLKTVSSITNAIGALNYKGTWNASTNTPTLASGVGTKGDYYVVSVAGTTAIDGLSLWGVGDWITFNGSVWQRVEGGANGEFVSAKAGNITLSGDSIAFDNQSRQIVDANGTPWEYQTAYEAGQNDSGGRPVDQVLHNRSFDTWTKTRGIDGPGWRSDGAYWFFSTFAGGAGDIYMTADTNGVILTSGATAWAAISDERHKVIIENIENASEKVNSLRAVIGRYKTDEANRRRSFLIAQDVQAVLPEAVKETSIDGEDAKLVLNYTDVIPLLIAAVKEQKQEIDNLKTQLQSLKGV